MADYYKVLTADPLGEPYTPNFPDAKPLLSYWCQVEGQEKSVMITKQVGNAVTPGDVVYGDLAYAKSQKGNEYWKFKSQKTPEGQPRPTSAAQGVAQQATGQTQMSSRIPDWFIPFGKQIEYIYLEMRKLDDTAPKEVVETPLTQHDVLKAVAEENQDKPAMTPEQQATYDEVFGGVPTPELEEPFTEEPRV